MTTPSRPLAVRLALAAGVVAVLALISSAAWLCDDAFITLRVVDNLWHGYGLRWNVLERVQVFTHPLWMLATAIAVGLTREVYWTVIGLSLATTLATLLAVTFRLAATPAHAGLALALFASAKGFVEFSTSGLENPLSHLVVAGLAAAAAAPAPSPGRLSALAALAALCRLDLLALAGPIWLAASWPALRDAPDRRHRVRIAAASALGWLPLAAWLGFAWIYYGSPIPNTALAKLPANVPRADLVGQGLAFLRDAWLSDPVTLLTIAAAGGHALAGRGQRAIAGALALSLAAIVSVGGDFMSGRFLTPAFVLAVCHLARGLQWRPALSGVAAAAALAVSAAGTQSPLRVWEHARTDERLVSHGAGIVDERAFYAGYTSLWARAQGRTVDDHPWAKGGRLMSLAPRIANYESVGLLGFYAGPGVHLVDPMALTDPLLARLPAIVPWRIGHFRRVVPDGYEAHLQACIDAAFPNKAIAPPAATCTLDPQASPFASPEITALYARVLLLTQAPLTDTARLAEMRRGAFEVFGAR
jgi:arabinofuranosyltransferase